MNQFSVSLEAIDAERGHFRSYHVGAGRDLLGDWIVEIRFGRIGTAGRLLRYVAQDEAGARAKVRECLLRRRSAPKRIGIPYRVTASMTPPSWGDLVAAPV